MPSHKALNKKLDEQRKEERRSREKFPSKCAELIIILKKAEERTAELEENVRAENTSQGTKHGMGTKEKSSGRRSCPEIYGVLVVSSANHKSGRGSRNVCKLCSITK